MIFQDEKFFKWAVIIQLVAFIFVLYFLVSIDYKISKMNVFEIPHGFKYFVIADEGQNKRSYYAKDYKENKASVFLIGYANMEKELFLTVDISLRLTGEVTVYNKYGRIVYRGLSNISEE